MEYSVTVWRTPIREGNETLFRLPFRREWVPERNCRRDVVIKQERWEAELEVSDGSAKGS